MVRHLRIVGIVQNVGYRAAFAAQARLLCLGGWVRNRRDGSVEAMVSGPTPSLEAIVAWARQGPASAQVDEVVVTELGSAALAAETFEILPTA